MSKSLFIIGTGTDVGKTYVSGLILKKLRESGAYCRPAYKAYMARKQTLGRGRRTDFRRRPVGKRAFRHCPAAAAKCVPVVYRAPAPHLAARLKGGRCQY